jgi:hypothetical protein
MCVMQSRSAQVKLMLAGTVVVSAIGAQAVSDAASWKSWYISVASSAVHIDPSTYREDKRA